MDNEVGKNDLVYIMGGRDFHVFDNAVGIVFYKNLKLFLYKINFFKFLNYLDTLLSKIILKNKKYYFNIKKNIF